MACRINKKIPRSCNFSVGGVSLIYLTNWGQITGWSDTNTDNILDQVSFNTTTITDVSTANPAVVTAVGHGLNSGDVIEIVGTSPMDGLVGQHTITVLTSDTFELVGYDSTALAPYGASVVVVQEGAFYEYEFEKDTASFNAELIISNGNKYIQHQLTMNTKNFSQAAQEQMDQLALSRTTAVAKDKNGNFVILGRNNGMEPTALSLTSGTGAGDAYGYTIVLQGEEFEYPQEWDNVTNGLPLSAASV